MDRNIYFARALEPGPTHRGGDRGRWLALALAAGIAGAWGTWELLHRDSTGTAQARASAGLRWILGQRGAGGP